MILFPESATYQLEFDKIKALLGAHCKTEFAKNKAGNLQIHTKKEFIELWLQQTHEYKLLLQNQLDLPGDHTFNVSKEIKLLGIQGAALNGDQLLTLKKLTENIRQIFRWFDNERRIAYPALGLVISETYFEKIIIVLIDDILDESGNVKDNASEKLASVRLGLYKKRNELRRIFNRIVGRLNKLGYLADIEESFMNGRRVLAVFAEQKRIY